MELTLRIAKISYSENVGEPSEWGFSDFVLADSNLIVGDGYDDVSQWYIYS